MSARPPAARACLNSEASWPCCWRRYEASSVLTSSAACLAAPVLSSCTGVRRGSAEPRGGLSKLGRASSRQAPGVQSRRHPVARGRPRMRSNRHQHASCLGSIVARPQVQARLAALGLRRRLHHVRLGCGVAGRRGHASAVRPRAGITHPAGRRLGGRMGAARYAHPHALRQRSQLRKRPTSAAGTDTALPSVPWNVHTHRSMAWWDAPPADGQGRGEGRRGGGGAPGLPGLWMSGARLLTIEILQPGCGEVPGALQAAAEAAPVRPGAGGLLRRVCAFPAALQTSPVLA